MVDTGRLDDLKPDPDNARAHNPRNVGMIESALNEVGAARSIVVDEDGVILAGNATVEAAAAAGIERVVFVDADGETIVAVRRRNLTPEQKRRLALYDNRTAELATWDLDAILGLSTGDALDGLFSSDEIDDLLSGYREDAIDAEDIAPAESRAEMLQAEWQTALGQRWIIPAVDGAGYHVLVCGDATDAGAVERCLGTDRVELVWTDPPYGVAVGDKNAFLQTVQEANRITRNLTNDELDEAGLDALLTGAFALALEHQDAGGAWYVTAPPGPLHLVFGGVLNRFGIIHQTIQWVKNNATFSPLGTDYHWEHEPIYYGWKPGGAHRYYGGRKQTTVWRIDRPAKSPDHPTMKPVELVTRAIQNSTLPGQIVYDPFNGSGTTILAAEQTNRRGRAIEIDPGYVAVSLQRFADYGMTPKLAEE
jgi:DNA modification methylase